MRRISDSGWQLPSLDDRMQRYLASGEWEAQTIRDLALARIDEDPDRLIIADDDKTLTRGNLFELACRLGSALHRLGLRPGSVVAFQLPNWSEACVISAACALYGFVLTPMLPIYRERELGFILAETNCQALFIPSEFRGYDHKTLAARVLAGLSNDVHVFTVRESSRDAASYEALIEDAADTIDFPEIDPASIKTITFTSGTTGHPKGVLHSHFTAHATVRRAIAFWGLTDADRLFVPSPVGHIGGSLYAFELPWFTGASAHLTAVWDAERAVERIDRDGLSFSAGATPFLQGLLEHARNKETRLPSLRRFICGGAAVPAALVEEATARFDNAVVTRAYGSTEVPLICPGIRTRTDAVYGQTTDGQIDADVRILDDDGQPVRQGADGDIVVKSPSAFVGYLDSDDEVGQFTDDGYFRMGDVGRVIDGAFLKITGRKKDIIIRLGENISAPEIESALMACDAVKLAAVIGVPNERTGERAVAFVELAPGASFDFEAMTGFLSGYGLARQKYPEELHILESLPTNSIGKVVKFELKRMALDSEAD